ncbi:MAG: o-succinylbenzoate synthase [Candidatus Binatia bacterium]
MKVRCVDATPFRIPFRHPFVIAGVSVQARAGILVEVHDDDGHVGLGEASPDPRAGPEVLREAMDALSRAAQMLRAIDPKQLDTTLEQLEAVPPGIARAGLEMACCDLVARSAAVRLAELWRCRVPGRVPVNAVIDTPDPCAAATAARACVAEGFRCIKLKIAPGDVGREVARLAAVRDAVGPEIRLRIDANAIWTPSEAIDAISQLAVHGVEYVEQPVATLAALAQVRRAVDTPIAADECVTGANAVECLAETGAADLVIVKPTLIGVRTARAVIHRAHTCSLGVVVTSALDTSIGIAAAVHLAATLPDPIRPCGLATASLLAGDLTGETLVPHGGWLHVPPHAGLGVRLDEAAVQRWRHRL